MPFLVHWRGPIAFSNWRGRDEALRALAAAGGAVWLAASAASSLAIGGMMAHPDPANFGPSLSMI